MGRHGKETPPEFRRKVLNLLRTGRTVRQTGERRLRAIPKPAFTMSAEPSAPPRGEHGICARTKIRTSLTVEPLSCDQNSHGCGTPCLSALTADIRLVGPLSVEWMEVVVVGITHER